MCNRRRLSCCTSFSSLSILFPLFFVFSLVDDELTDASDCRESSTTRLRRILTSSDSKLPTPLKCKVSSAVLSPSTSLTLPRLGDNPKVLNGTADAHIASFFTAAAAPAADGSGSEDEDESKPKTGAGAKRKPAAPKKSPTKVKVKAEKGAKQTKLSFGKASTSKVKDEEDYSD